MRKIVYEISFNILAIISVILAIIDINSGLLPWQEYIDIIIWIIFVIDYFARLIYSKEKKKFFKQNIFDLIAIIPFNSALRIFRSFKALRLLKLTKLAKSLALGARILRRAEKFLNINGFKYMLFLSICLVIVGGIAISSAEDMELIDGIWWAFVTTTTVGYGDISPATALGRIIACILMVTGIGLIGSLTSTITSYFMHTQKNTSISNDRVDMVLKMYNILSDQEKELFDKLK